MSNERAWVDNVASKPSRKALCVSSPSRQPTANNINSPKPMNDVSWPSPDRPIPWPSETTDPPTSKSPTLIDAIKNKTCLPSRWRDDKPTQQLTIPSYHVDWGFIFVQFHSISFNVVQLVIDWILRLNLNKKIIKKRVLKRQQVE